MTLPDLNPALGATITWLTDGARSANQPQEVLHQLCSQLIAAGLVIDRCAVVVSTLHPSVMARRFLWNPGQLRALRFRGEDQDFRTVGRSSIMTGLIVTNGDSAASLLREAGLVEEILPWRDILHEGPVPATGDLESLSAIRATFLAHAFAQPLEIVRRDFEQRDRSLVKHAERVEITLWFEHDLYDQLQLLQLLDFFHRRAPSASLFLVQADDYLGQETPTSIRRFEGDKTAVSDEQMALAARLFTAFRQATPTALAAFLDHDLSPLPYMQPALRRLFQDLPSAQNGLSLTQRRALGLAAQEKLPMKRLFGAAQQQEEAVFLGDWSYWRCLDELAFNTSPLIRGLPDRFNTSAADDERKRYLDAVPVLTDTGHAVLAGDADHAKLNRIDRWLGGTHVTGNSLWRWDHGADCLVPPS